jgi:DNA-binding transcriptional regulator YhcF (GntR family)
MPITNLAPPPRPLTPTETFYLQAFTILATHLRRSPTLREFARYTSRNIHTVHDALRVLVGAGALAQDVESGRYKLPSPPRVKSRTKRR